jgi:hypothetical protein
MNSYGFIITRHVNSEKTNKYWNRCIRCIRRFYPFKKIVVIDDNSNQDFVKAEFEYKNVEIINSEFPGRGELLPYYYYAQYKWFDYAVILHDSVFINYPIHFNVKKYKLLWEFEHHWDQIEDETNMIKLFNNSELLKFYEDKKLWKGCFGGMSIITHDYLKYMNSKYDISKLLDCVVNRYNRCSFERVIACLLQKQGNQQTLLGDIHKYCKWGIRFNEIDNYKNLPLIKCWSGR